MYNKQERRLHCRSISIGTTTTLTPESIGKELEGDAQKAGRIKNTKEIYTWAGRGRIARKQKGGGLA